MIVRIGESGRPAFQLRKGEEGLSVFETDAVEPPLIDSEILESFRPESLLVIRSVEEIESKGLRLVSVPGAGSLPSRLNEAHFEIQAGERMTRAQFKQALKELE
jgi:hypothetical protein